LENECLDLAGLHPEDLRDLLMRVVAQLEQDERSSLIVRQPPDLVDHLAQILTALHLVGQIAELRPRVVGPRLALPACADLGQTAVSRDRVEPRPQHDLARTLPHRSIGGHERQLQRILGRFSALEHVHAEREQPARVPVVDLLERGVHPGTDSDNQILVSLDDGSCGRVPTLLEDLSGCAHGHSVLNLALRIQSRLRRISPMRCGDAPAVTVLLRLRAVTPSSRSGFAQGIRDRERWPGVARA
jgi:hypothetical protein